MRVGSPEVVKWYTRARKFPVLLGRTPDGARLWGGPYTFTQAIAGGSVLFVGLNTMGLWARYGLLGNALVLLGVAYGTVLALGRLPIGSRNPLAVLTGAVSALAAPSTGRVDGRRIRLRRPHRVDHTMTVLLTAPPHQWSAGEAVATGTSSPEGRPAPRVPLPSPTDPDHRPVTATASSPGSVGAGGQLTGVQELLARAGQTTLGAS